MELTSSAFEHYGKIPVRYSCQGESISPPLQIGDVPETAQSLALIVNDPDAPGGSFIHWLVWNIDPKTTEINEGEIPEEAIEGINSAGGNGYTGPCPPLGEHHYVFTLYALDKVLELRPDASIHNLQDAMSEHVVSETELVGLYSRE